MQETIIALGALMIITMTSVNQQRTNFMIMEGAYIQEMETFAADYGNRRLEQILNRSAYDESRVGASEYDSDLVTLSSAGAFGPDAGESNPINFDDIDDYHGYQETIRHGISVDTLGFEVSYSVRYVNPAMPTQASASPTLTKELTINVQSQDSIGHKSAQFVMSKLVNATDGW